MSRYVLYGGTGTSSTKDDKTSYAFDIVNNKSDVFNNQYYENESGKHQVTDLTKVNTSLIKPEKESYFMDYDKMNGVTTASSLVNDLNISENFSTGSPMEIYNKNLNYYNRFKLPTPDDALQKGFAHVFFTRPDLNILCNNNTSLTPSFINNQEFQYAWKNSPDSLRSLVANNGSTHDFMLYLSNKVTSFSPSDEYIKNDTYGKTYGGHSISYGKNNIESKAAGDISIRFEDDRYYHLYQMNKIWVEYIHMVYRGLAAPIDSRITNKELDYASSIYYIVTAEDFETIIFWSKYYGTFPTTVPSSQFSFEKGSLISQPSYDIKFAYSFKKDYDPYSLVEFNYNSGVTNGKSEKYIPTFDAKIGHAGHMWTGAPYIEAVTNESKNGSMYNFKLRFRKGN